MERSREDVASPSLVADEPLAPTPSNQDGLQPGQTTRRFRHRKELTREQDVFKHLHPWTSIYKTDFPPSFADSTPGKPRARLPCPDTALAAFAQLAALRLDVRTCLVTLTSSTTTYVLADMSQDTPLQNTPNGYDGDGTWIGTSSHDRTHGLVWKFIDEWRRARHGREQPAQDDYYYKEGLSPHWFIASDMRSRSDLQEVKFAQHGPWIRFCVCLPLRGAQGSVIGSLILLDNKPRWGVSAAEMDVLEDLSDTIVEHLDATVVRAQRQRSDRLIQGLGLFNCGKDSMRDWWLSQDDKRLLGTGRNVDKGTAKARQARVDGEFGIQRDLGAQESHVLSPAADHPETAQARPALNTSDSLLKTRRNSLRNSLDVLDLSMSTTLAYSRASNLLREAVNADGVAFFSGNSVTTTLTRQESEESSKSGNSLPHRHIDAGREESGSGSGSDSGIDKASACRLLAFSTRTESTLSGHSTVSQPIQLSQRFLRDFVHKHPNGAFFHFDKHGHGHLSTEGDSSQSSNEESRGDSHLRSKDSRRLGRIVAGARVLAVYPLWDSNNDRCRSCILLWNRGIDGVIDPTESLTYLSAFGHSVSAELSRLETLAADKAKSTFISSISHELRSPLHGMLAGVEFLRDTALTAFQSEMTDTIDAAGRTLLDTVNHILDYSKISGFVRSHKGKSDRKGERTPSTAGGDHEGASVSQVDLARMTEDVVETCVAAHRPQLASPWSPTVDGSATHSYLDTQQRSPETGGSARDVAVTLNITRRPNWTVEVQPGAWTRIITNLLGNALKYTHKGTVSVRLEVTDPPVHKDESGNTEHCAVKLIIEDTGIGMSESFVSQSLFTPFTQENPHSAGTGLGLSIVRNITTSIGADLDVASKHGVGTKVTVGFLAKFVSTNGTRSKDPILDSFDHSSIARLALLTAAMILDGDNDDDDTASIAVETKDMDAAIADSIARNAEEWLDCEILRDSVAPDSYQDSSICAITQQGLVALAKDQPESLDKLLIDLATRHPHLIILADSIRSVTYAPGVFSQRHPIPVFIHQPIGPRKLMRAIASQRDSTLLGQVTDQAQRTNSVASSDQQENGIPSRLNQGPPANLKQRVDRVSGMSTNRPDFSKTVSFRQRPVTSTLTYTTSPPSLSGNESSASNMSIPESEPNTVMLVEDNEINMKLLITLLKRLNVPYECAVNGREAVTLYRQNPGAYFLILMDISMPVMDGFTATSKIREFQRSKHLPTLHVTALTGVTNADAKARAFACGVDDFYPKPVKMVELRELLRKLRGSDAG